MTHVNNTTATQHHATFQQDIPNGYAIIQRQDRTKKNLVCLASGLYFLGVSFVGGLGAAALQDFQRDGQLTTFIGAVK